MKSDSVSLTGATGFVGWHLAEAFRDQGWHVRAVVRPGGTGALPERIARVEAGLTDASALATAFDGSSLVLHCAGVVRARDAAAFAAVNVEGTRAVVEAANLAAGRLLLISSLAAGGPGTPDRPRRETDPDAPVNDYGRSKRAAEDVVRDQARLPWTILRPCPVYGPRDRGFLPLFRMARRGWFVRPTPAATAFTLINVHDLSRAVVLAAGSERAPGETFFIGHGQPQTSDGIMRTLAAAFDKRYAAFDLPRPLVRAAAALGDLGWRAGVKFVVDSGRLAEFDAPGFVCSVERAREQLGFTAATSLQEGFTATARWYEARGWL